MILQHGPLTSCSFFLVNTDSSATGQLIPMADIQRKVSMFPREVDLSVCLKVFYCQFYLLQQFYFYLTMDRMQEVFSPSKQK